VSDVFLNGKFIPADEAKVSVLDRGFVFGDGVYEVIPVYDGYCFKLKNHLKRLQNSLDESKIVNPYSEKQWEMLLKKLINLHLGGDQVLYIQVTRGVAVRDHVFPENTKPTVFVMSNLMQGVPEKYKKNGISAISLKDSRWQKCNIKSTSLLPNCLLKQQAKDAGAEEALLISDGYLTEGSTSNAYAVIGGVIYTAPKSGKILAGITREVVICLAEKAGLRLIEEPVAEFKLTDVDELWTSSSTKEVLPITRLNGVKVGEGVPGPVWQKIDVLYQHAKAEERNDG
jgi:D-alanine transaminase|tara:strand:- start:685 stop:1539 length:855 start_codon:yes stop_codon:yes gene_type:complete